jgi:hypothetical protein
VQNQIRLEQLLWHGVPKPKEKKYAKVDQTLQKAKVSLVSQFCLFEPFTVGYFWAIFLFLVTGANLFGAK